MNKRASWLKAFAVLLMVVFVFTFAACGGSKTETQPQTEPQSTSSETKLPDAKQAETAMIERRQHGRCRWDIDILGSH